MGGLQTYVCMDKVYDLPSEHLLRRSQGEMHLLDTCVIVEV